ncbi:MAG: hypothetical protein O2816_03375 [Planctomycetota bacterium]|nr:hypothetical protein [Planctomycetota bacterium]
MTTICNRTKKPVSVPLPGGKRLFLGPGKTGEVSPKALEHVPLRQLVEAGEIEILEAKSPGRRGGGGSGGRTGGSKGGGAHRPEGGIRHSGDR